MDLLGTGLYEAGKIKINGKLPTTNILNRFTKPCFYILAPSLDFTKSLLNFPGGIRRRHVTSQFTGSGKIRQPPHPGGGTAGLQMSDGGNPRSNHVHHQGIPFGKTLH